MERVRKLTVYLFFLMVSLSIYANSLNGKFILDDKVLLVDNMYVKDIRLMPKLFTTGAFHFKSGNNRVAGDYYRPLQTLTYSFDYIFWKLNPFGYHLTNIFIHSLNSFLVFLFIYLVFKDTVLALLSASLFCVHPIQPSLVAFISGRGHLLEMMFMLLSLITFVRFVESRKTTAYCLSLLLFILSLLSWEGGLLSPLIIVVCIIYIRGQKIELGINNGAASVFRLGKPWTSAYGASFLSTPKKRIIFYSLPYFLISLIYLWMRTKYMPTDKLGVSGIFSLQHIFGFFWFLYSYIHQLILPYDIRAMMFSLGLHLKLFLFSVSFIFLIFFLIRAIIYRDRVATFAFLFYSIGLLSVLNLFDTIKYFGIILSEHYVYISSVGFCIFVSWLLIKLKSRFKKIASNAFVMIILAYSALTVVNNTNYKDELTFYNHILRVDKDNIFIRINLGDIYLNKKIYAQAVKQAELVLAKEPNAWDAYLLLGNVFKEEGMLKKAQEFYNLASQANPYASEPLNNLGIIYGMQGQADKALELFRKAVKISPESLPVLHNLVDVLMGVNLYSEALVSCNRILELSPNDVAILVKIGIILAESSRHRDAEIIFKEALRLDPNSIDALSNLGSLYANTGDFGKAKLLWNNVLKVKPEDEEIKKKLKELETMSSY